MNAQQARAARAALKWNADETAKRAGLGSKVQISRFENETTKPHSATIEKLREAFEAAGISFGDDGKSISWK